MKMYVESNWSDSHNLVARTWYLRAAPVFVSPSIHEILAKRGICVRLTAGQASFIFGNERSQSPPVEFSIASEKLLYRLVRRMRLADFAMAYINGTLAVKGSITKAVEALDAINVAVDRRQTVSEFMGRLFLRGLKILIPQYAKTFESIDHYSQSASAYELFLDKYMQYTCGHFPKGNENIDEAQVAKFQLIANRIEAHIGSLRGKEHLDIGCGWGGMLAYFQSHLGTQSLGNTNCERQADYARHRFGAEILLGDFLHLRRTKIRFDFITIIGMIEHLTPYRRDQLLGTVANLLKPNGVVYLQCITKPKIWIGGDAYRIARREVFRGHFLETRDQTTARLNKFGFAVLECKEHHNDYARTTALWVEHLERNADKIIALIGARQYRIYLGYLAYASRLFSIEDRGSLMRYVLKKSS